MSYQLFEIPSGDKNKPQVDVVWADISTPDRRAYNHLAYTVETDGTEKNVLEKRGLQFKHIRDWDQLKVNSPEILEALKQGDTYYPGKSVLGNSEIIPDHQIRTVLRIGALELLANIYSGRITASDKDPFPHQLALQQYVKNHESHLKRILIADEVGLGKTIEVGLVLRDKLMTLGENFRCLYLTSGGLKEDVKEKLKTVIKDDKGGLIRVIDSLREYGDKIQQEGISIASMHAARLYIDKRSKKELSKGIKPNIIVIDECHHCASNAELKGINLEQEAKKKSSSETTQAYKAAYQIITGQFWENSEPPELVILMSATPFRSANQFTNLLRLLSHQTNDMKDAYSSTIDQRELINLIANENSPVTVIWRQQDEVRNWLDKRLFPQLKIIRPHRDGEPKLERTNDEYLATLEHIKRTVQRIYRDHGNSFGGFATAHLETRLTSSSLAGACWLFRWCVRHHPKWRNEKEYRNDNSEATVNLRELIREISEHLSKFDMGREEEYAKEVKFPSDGNFSFKSRNLQDGKIPAIFEFQKELIKQAKNQNDDEEEENLEAQPEEILELTNLALDLLKSGKTVENAKLNWLTEMLDTDPNSRFLVFTEVLQTTAIITAQFPNSLALTGGMSAEERKEQVGKFYDRNRNYRILVATSAADEGLDFQVANKVVHWDLSPDPAILMQRNGRVARLGQVADVTAYYLILEGTLAEKRDSALLDRLIEAGLTDQRQHLKIFGYLDRKQEDKIAEAINNKEKERTIDKVLEDARQKSDTMEKELRQLNQQLAPQWVLDRNQLLERLKKWYRFGVNQYTPYSYRLNFDSKSWQRPVFSEDQTKMESASADILEIQQGRNKKYRFVFDPEFSLFSQEKNIDGLAGLLPWMKRGEPIETHTPLGTDDVVGSLSQSLARLTKADFLAVSARELYQKLPDLENCSYLLFSTHPLRELEESNSSEFTKYLTYYSFADDLTKPINPQGASPRDVNNLINFIEEQVNKESFSMNEAVIEEAKKAGKSIGNWIEKALTLNESIFGESSSYFVPIPIALVAII